MESYFKSKPHINFKADQIDPDNIKETSDLIKEEITCLLCYNVVRNPVQCSERKCAKMFCQNCAFDLTRNNKTCPNRCQGSADLKVEEISRNVRTMLSGYKFKCLYESQGCTEIITIDNYNKHHTEECKFLAKECLCGKVLNKQEVNAHMTTCNVLNPVCSKCESKFPKDKFDAHFLKCSPYKKCEICKYIVNYSIWKEHQKECEDYDLECSYCRTIFPKSQENLHTEEKCFEITSKYNK